MIIAVSSAKNEHPRRRHGRDPLFLYRSCVLRDLVVYDEGVRRGRSNGQNYGTFVVNQNNFRWVLQAKAVGPTSPLFGTSSPATNNHPNSRASSTQAEGKFWPSIFKLHHAGLSNEVLLINRLKVLWPMLVATIALFLNSSVIMLSMLVFIN